MTGLAFERAERLERGRHSSKVPELAVIVVRARDDSCAGRVDRQGRHGLERGGVSLQVSVCSSRLPWVPYRLTLA